jgi:hypothetical protein
MPELEQDVKEFFESGGEKSPEVEKSEPKSEVPPKEYGKEPPKEVQKEAAKAPEKDPKEEQSEDPHAENHRKALKEAREELKKFKREQKEKEEQSAREMADMREKFRMWNEAVQKANQPQPPKFEEDPANHLKYQVETQARELEELRQFRQQQAQLTQQQQAIQKFQSDFNSYEAQFAQEQPDYPQAAQYIANLWQSEIELSGVPQEQIGQAYFWKVAQFANMAIRRGENPATAVYELAKRAGYKAQEPQKPEAEKKIEALQKGQEASKSLGGGKPDADLSLEALASMSPEDIERFVRDPKAWKKLANG